MSEQLDFLTAGRAGAPVADTPSVEATSQSLARDKPAAPRTWTGGIVHVGAIPPGIACRTCGKPVAREGLCWCVRLTGDRVECQRCAVELRNEAGL